jgi:hypothetical protein
MRDIVARLVVLALLLVFARGEAYDNVIARDPDPTPDPPQPWSWRPVFLCLGCLCLVIAVRVFWPKRVTVVPSKRG